MMTDDDKELVSFLSTKAKDPAEPLLRAGDFVGNWRVIAFLGGGGFGEVYRVIHALVGIVCALKVLNRDTETARLRFKREVSYVAMHSCEGVPRFYEMGMCRGRPYFVMEMLAPRELPSEDRAIAGLLKELCRIVSGLHREGFVHRDIKPENVLYRENGAVVLADYGLIAKGRGRDINAARSFGNGPTQEIVAVGTIRYAAPEQLSGTPIDGQADIHALGVLIDTCFRGHAPRRWRNIVCRATSSLPERRYPSCRALSKAITFRYLEESTIALLVVASVAVIFSAIVVSGRIGHHNEEGALASPGANAGNSVRGKNVSDAADEWLAP